MAIGPTIDNGFYYDIDVDESLSQEDLKRSKLSHAKIWRNQISGCEKNVSWQEARDTFESGEPYKMEILDEKRISR